MSAKVLKFPSRPVCTADAPAAPVTAPSLPDRLASLIGSGEYWRRPQYADIAPLADEIRQAAEMYERAMEPAPEIFIRYTLNIMAVTLTAPAGGAAAEIRDRQFIRLFRDIPADIWQQAADRAMLERETFPAPAELNAYIEPLWRERQLTLSRLIEIKSIVDNPPATRPQSEEDRARETASSVRALLDAGMFNTPQELARPARALMEDLQAEGEAADDSEDTS
ncbi:MAG: hypothetical protein ACLFWF_10885 [Alphaproteobacteria bacterium]